MSVNVDYSKQPTMTNAFQALPPEAQQKREKEAIVQAMQPFLEPHESITSIEQENNGSYQVTTNQGREFTATIQTHPFPDGRVGPVPFTVQISPSQKG